MELLICQTCGHIIRGRSKSCNGCGVSVSKHSPTLVSQGLNSGAALTVGAQNDPLVLERTVNQLIYKNGNGNGNGNGYGHYTDVHGTGSSYGPDGPRLYDENDLSKIIFPVSENSSSQYSEAPPEYSSESNGGDYSDDPSEYESQRSDDYLEEGPSSDGDSNSYSEEPQREYEREPENDNYASHQGCGMVAGTPMAAGAAHAMAALTAATAAGAVAAGAFAQGDAEPNYDEQPVAENYAPEDPGDFSQPANEQVNEQQEPQYDYQPPQAVDSEPPNETTAPSGGSDFFSNAPSRDTAPPPGAGDFSAAPNSAPSPSEQFQQSAAASAVMPPSAEPVGAGASPWASMPMGDAVPMPAEIAAAVVASTPSFDQSATVVARMPEAPPRPAMPPPGGMDFFAATNSSAPAAPVAAAPAPAAEASSNTPAEIASFMQGAQASIIQNAIQAAMNSQVQPERTFSNDTASGTPSSAPSAVPGEEPAAPERKPKSKKKLRPKPEAREDDEDSPTTSSSKSKKKLELSATKSGKSAKSLPSSIDMKTKSEDEPKQLKIAGFPVPAKMIGIAAVLIVFVGFPIMVLLANVSSILSGLGGALGGGGGAASSSSGGGASSGMTLNGQWDFAYQNPNQSIGRGLLNLTQNGDNVEGYGVDKTQFQIRGTLKGNTLTFNKQYVQGGQPMGKPILYQGKIDYANANPPQGQPYVHISGVWQLTKREGFSWRAQIVSLSGKWEAALTKPGNAGNGTAVASNNGSSINVSTPSGNAMGENKDPKKAHDFFMKVAMGIIGIGVVLAMLSLKFFGPSGLLNIWAKKEYIPSQFKAPHYKMVAEMGKPLKVGGVPLGTREEWGIHQFWRPRLLNMPPELREQNPHCLILGAGAKGKSRLMASMIVNDIEAGDRAVVLVDSDGALADLVMNWVAAHPKGKQMAKRVIVIDPTHDGETICYNPLEFPEDGDLQNAASALVFGFKAIYTEPPGSQSQWNQQTANILRNSGVLLMANGKTLTDLPVLLSDNDFRDIMLEKVERMKNEKSEYTTLIEAWMNYKRLARTDQWINWIEPILNRVQPMLGDPRIRPILTKARGDLNLKHIITDKKVLLVKIPQGQLDQNANLLGSLIVTGVKQAALSLSVRGKAKQRPCALYLDEFDTFIEKETFDAITSETRKFQIGFCGASKTLQILPEDYRNQIIINVGMMTCFALAKKDGDMLGPQMFRVDGRKVKHQTIQNVFNKVNTSPQFELISDEEKLNIDRVVGQEERTYFCYRVGTVAGVFNMKSPDFKDIADKDINWDIIDTMYGNRQDPDQTDADGDDEEEDDEE